MKVGFIGIGKLGKDAAEVMHEAGHDVLGYDTRIVSDCKFEMTFTLEDVCKDRELIFIAVPTPHHPDYDGSQPTSHLEPKDFDYSIVKSVLEEVNQYTTKEQLVVLISTVLPGTTRREFIPLIKNVDIVDRIRIQGALESYFSGGSILHLNIIDKITQIIKDNIFYIIPCKIDADMNYLNDYSYL